MHSRLNLIVILVFLYNNFRFIKSLQIRNENVDYSNHSSVKLLENKCSGNTTIEKLPDGQTSIYDFPWMAIIQYNSQNGSRQLCSGSVINKRYILTAAQCVSSLDVDFTVDAVILGEHDLQTEIDCDYNYTCTEPIQIIEIEKTIPHPSYNRRKNALFHDIGLIRLAADIQFTSTVQPICLPITNTAIQTNLTHIKESSWGTHENGTRSRALFQSVFSTINNTFCQTLIKEKIAFDIDETQLCVTNEAPKNNEDCIGDLGGPAISLVNTTDGLKYVQYGIAITRLDACGGYSELAGIYTRVVPYMKWILDNITA